MICESLSEFEVSKIYEDLRAVGGRRAALPVPPAVTSPYDRTDHVATVRLTA